MHERPKICYNFDKQRIQGYQISHFEQSTGQLFPGQPDQDRQGQLRIAQDRVLVHLADLSI